MNYTIIYTNNELIMYSENVIIYKETIDLKKGLENMFLFLSNLKIQ